MSLGDWKSKRKREAFERFEERKALNAAELQAYRDKLGTPPDVTCATGKEDKWS